VPIPIVIPLAAIGAAYLAARNGYKQSDDTQSEGENTVKLQDWDSLLNELGGNLPPQFLSRWIVKESGGNPCSIGRWSEPNGPREAGLGQIYFETDSSTPHGVTLSQLRMACSGQTLTRDLTDDEKRPHVTSLVSEAQACMNIALQKTASLYWTLDDTLCLAKLYFNVPVLLGATWQSATDGGYANDWNGYRDWLLSIDADTMASIDSRVVPYIEKGKLGDILSNAQYVGRGV
jgi:hypothetical protein